jgi:metal-responsive CopG/Arc/MetJ family transcriptional regulator
MYTRSQLLHIKLSAELLAMIDEAAAKNFQTRSAYIRECIALRLNKEPEPSLSEILAQSLRTPEI